MTTILSYYKFLNKPVFQKWAIGDVLLLIPRVICGWLLAVNFGADKFGLPWSPDERNLGLFEVIYWFPKDVENFGGIFSLFPGFFAWMAAFSEAVGGLLLLIGFQTRIAAFLITCTMLVAIFGQQYSEGLWNMMGPMGFLWVAMYCMVLGSGRFGLDAMVDKSLKK